MTSAGLSCEVIMLATKEIEDYAKYSSELWSKYCDHKGYHFRRYTERIIPDMHVNWSKIEMVRQHLNNSKADVVTLVDADTYVCNLDMSLTDMLERASPKSMVFSPDTCGIGIVERPLNCYAALSNFTRRLPNAGFIIMKNSDFARQFFADWMELARNKLNHLADKHPRNQRVLWKGLYFQNRDKIALLDGEVRRVATEFQIGKAIKQGCDVIHVRGGLPQKGVTRLLQRDRLEISCFQ